MTRSCRLCLLVAIGCLLAACEGPMLRSIDPNLTDLHLDGTPCDGSCRISGGLWHTASARYEEEIGDWKRSSLRRSTREFEARGDLCLARAKTLGNSWGLEITCHSRGSLPTLRDKMSSFQYFAVMSFPEFSDHDRADIAKNDEDERYRAAAAREVQDQVLVTAMAKNEESSVVRAAAAANPNLSDQAVLVGIAKSDEDSFVRAAAAANPNLGDQAVLTDIAKNDEREDVRRAAVQNPNLTDRAVLSDIANNDEHYLVRAAAAEKLRR